MVKLAFNHYMQFCNATMVATCFSIQSLLFCKGILIWHILTSAFFFFREQALKIVLLRSSAPDNVPHRLIWSPHIPLPEEEEEEQEICTIVLTHGTDVSVRPCLLLCMIGVEYLCRSLHAVYAKNLCLYELVHNYASGFRLKY